MTIDSRLQEIFEATAELRKARAEAESLLSQPPHRISQDMEREQIADMVAASEARNETKLEKVMGEVRTEFASLRGDIRELKASSASKGTVILTGVTVFFGLAGLLVAFLTFGSQWFGLGLDSGAVAQQAAERALASYSSTQVPPKQ